MDFQKCINEDENPRKIRKYTQRVFKDIFSEDTLKEYLKRCKKLCAKNKGCKYMCMKERLDLGKNCNWI